LAAGLCPDLLGSLSAPPDPLAAVKGLGPQKGRRKEREKENGLREEGTGRGPQFEKNDPPRPRHQMAGTGR